MINVGFSQIPTAGSNTIRPDLNKFEGTWKWSNGTSEVVIQLKKINFYYPDEQYQDVIMGCHKYIVNGTVVQKFLPDFVNLNQANQSSLFLFTEMDGSMPNKIGGDIKDPSKHKNENLTLEFISGVTPTLIWHLQVKGEFIIAPTLPGLTLPADFILIKQ